jgi:hypothetical protein
MELELSYHGIIPLESYQGDGTIPWDHTMAMESYHGIIPRRWNYTMESYQGHGIIPWDHTKDMGSYHGIIIPWNHTKDMESYHGIIPRPWNYTKTESYHSIHRDFLTTFIYQTKSIQNNNTKFTCK